MDFFTSLWKTYKRAQEENLVDQHGDGPVLLPLYHENKRANKNIINVRLNNDGTFRTAEWLDDDTRIIFPVTESSITRTANLAPHVLVDKFKTYSPDTNALYDFFFERLDQWIAQADSKVATFLTIIKNTLQDEHLIENIAKSLYDNPIVEDLTVSYQTDKGDTKSIDLSDVFLEFTVEQFNDLVDKSVTNYTELHQSYIDFVEAQNQQDAIEHPEWFDTCMISGTKQRIAKNHRTVFGRSGLISISNHSEAYKGRYKDQKDAKENMIRIGQETSDMIHLMLKYLLENKNSGVWLGGDQYMVTWFDDDLINNHGLDLKQPETFENLFDAIPDNDTATVKPNQTNKNIRNSVATGVKRYDDQATYNIAILNKTAPGRTSLKYFRQLSGSQLTKNLNKWIENYSWATHYKDTDRRKTPSIQNVLTVAFGLDRKAQYLDFDNEAFQSVLYQELLSALIDGKPIPQSITQKMKVNIKSPQRYPHHWQHVLETSMGVLHKANGKDFSPMLDQNETNRSYLFGRLLAIYELIERQKYYHIDGQMDRDTNAKRLWTAYTSNPTKVMTQLENKTKSYEEALFKRSPGIAVKLQKEKQAIITALDEHRQDKNFSKPLDYTFIFGYNGQINQFYSKSESETLDANSSK